MPAEAPVDVCGDVAPFRAAYAPPDEALASALLVDCVRPADAEARIDDRARRLVGAIRARVGGLGGRWVTRLRR